MADIVDIKIGQSLPSERWQEAAENLEMVFPIVAQRFRFINHEGCGEEDVQDFMADAQRALIALRYVAECASENCRFIPLEGLGLK